MSDFYVKDGDEYKPLSDDNVVLSKSDLNDKYVPKDVFGETVEAKVNARFKSHVHRDKVFDDEVLVAQFQEKFGGKTEDVDLDAKRKQWETANLVPVRQELEQTRSQVESITDRLRYREMRERFGSVFDNTFTDRIDPKKPSLAELMVGDQIEYDIESGGIKLKNSTMSIEDYAKELVLDEKYKRFAKEPERNTSNAKIGQDKVSGNSVSVKRRSQMTDEEKRAYKDKFGATVPKVEGTPAYMQLKL